MRRDQDEHAQRTEHVKTKGEDNHLQAKEKAFRMKSVLLTC